MKRSVLFRVLLIVWLIFAGSTPFSSSVQAAAPQADAPPPAEAEDVLIPLQDANSVQAACVNPLQTATLARRDDVLAITPLTRFNQPNFAWSDWSGGMVNGALQFSAADRNRMIEMVSLQTDGSLTHAYISPDSPLSGRNVDGSVSLGKPNGLYFTGRPELLVRSPFEMWIIARANNNTLWYKAWKNNTGLPDTSKWGANWVQVPNVANAVGGLTAIFRDTNHLEVFYKSTGNQAFFIEWAFGQWMQAPVALFECFI